MQENFLYNFSLDGHLEGSTRLKGVPSSFRATWDIILYFARRT